MESEHSGSGEFTKPTVRKGIIEDMQEDLTNDMKDNLDSDLKKKAGRERVYSSSGLLNPQ